MPSRVPGRGKIQTNSRFTRAVSGAGAENAGTETKSRIPARALTQMRMSMTLERRMPDRATFGETLFLVQIGVGVALVLFLLWRFYPENRRSNFKDRGTGPRANRQPKAGTGKRSPDELAESRIRKDKTRAGPLRLEGFRFDRAAHEILGISPLASRTEIQSAYREAMKRHHPDRVAAPGSAQWQDAQAIAQAILQARDELFEKAKRRGK